MASQVASRRKGRFSVNNLVAQFANNSDIKMTSTLLAHAISHLVAQLISHGITSMIRPVLSSIVNRLHGTRGEQTKAYGCKDRHGHRHRHSQGQSHSPGWTSIVIRALSTMIGHELGGVISRRINGRIAGAFSRTESHARSQAHGRNPEHGHNRGRSQSHTDHAHSRTSSMSLSSSSHTSSPHSVSTASHKPTASRDTGEFRKDGPRALRTAQPPTSRRWRDGARPRGLLVSPAG